MAYTNSIAPEAIRNVNALVFDFDGTLARLEIDFGEMRERVMAAAAGFGWRRSGEDVRYVLETMTRIESDLAEVSAEKAAAFTAAARDVIESIELDAARRGGLFPDTRPALEVLKNEGYRLAVITRNFGGAVRIVFPDLADFCPVFLPREAVGRVKPDPSHLLLALERLEARPERAVMVGDHPIDIVTGRAAGTWTAGVASGRNGAGELAEAGADLVFHRIGELADFILDRR